MIKVNRNFIDVDNEESGLKSIAIELDFGGRREDRYYCVNQKQYGNKKKLFQSAAEALDDYLLSSKASIRSSAQVTRVENVGLTQNTATVVKNKSAILFYRGAIKGKKNCPVWSELDPGEKAKYHEMASEDKKRYERECDAADREQARIQAERREKLFAHDKHAEKMIRGELQTTDPSDSEGMKTDAAATAAAAAAVTGVSVAGRCCGDCCNCSLFANNDNSGVLWIKENVKSDLLAASTPRRTTSVPPMKKLKLSPGQTPADKVGGEETRMHGPMCVLPTSLCENFETEQGQTTAAVATTSKLTAATEAATTTVGMNPPPQRCFHLMNWLRENGRRRIGDSRIGVSKSERNKRSSRSISEIWRDFVKLARKGSLGGERDQNGHGGFSGWHNCAVHEKCYSLPNHQVTPGNLMQLGGRSSRRTSASSFVVGSFCKTVYSDPETGNKDFYLGKVIGRDFNLHALEVNYRGEDDTNPTREAIDLKGGDSDSDIMEIEQNEYEMDRVLPTSKLLNNN